MDYLREESTDWPRREGENSSDWQEGETMAHKCSKKFGGTKMKSKQSNNKRQNKTGNHN